MNSKLSINWDLYQNNICNGFSSLQQLGEFVDMTLAADGHFVKVHQTLIALASPYLRALIKTVPTQHPVIFLDNVDHITLCSILEYIYTGEVVVSRDKLHLFTRAAKALCLTGIENILEKNKEFQQMLLDQEYEESDYNSEEEITNTFKMDPLPTELVSQMYESKEDQTNDDYFRPQADTIEINVESELNIPFDTGNKDMFNNSTDNFENTLRQIPTPLLTPSGNNLGTFVNLKSPMPQLDVSPHDFNCDSNSSFHMEQFLKGLNPTNEENAQDAPNAAADFTDGQTEVYSYTVEPISQKAMPMIDINKGFTMPLNNTEEQYCHQGYKGFKRMLTEEPMPYSETNQSTICFKKMRSLDENSICLSPLLNLIDNNNINVDNTVGEEETMPAETDNRNAIDELMSMPLLDATPESAPTEVAKDCQIQRASQIEITNTGELFVRPRNPGEINSLRYHRKNKTSSYSSIPNIVTTCTIDEEILPCSRSIANLTQQQPEESIIELHIPETEENMDVTDLSLASEVTIPKIVKKVPPNKPQIVDKKQTQPKIPSFKIKIPENKNLDRVKSSNLFKRVTGTGQTSVQIIKIAENRNDLSAGTSTPACGVRRIAIKKTESDISKVKVKKIKRIQIKKAPGTSKSEDTDKEATPTMLGLKFKLPEPKRDTVPSKATLETASVHDKVSILEADKHQETFTNQQPKQIIKKSPGNIPTILISRKDNADATSVNVRVPVMPNPDASMIQYSLSERGCLQIIVNRFLYRCHHTHLLKRRWRCLDYYHRHERCPAFIDTIGDSIVERVNAHQHPFHDRKIYEKMRKNLVFSAITQAEEIIRDQARLRTSGNESD